MSTTPHTDNPPVGNGLRDESIRRIGGAVIDHLRTIDVEKPSLENGSKPAQIEEESDGYEILEPLNNTYA